MNEESKIWDCIEYLEAEGFLIRPVKGHRTDVGDGFFVGDIFALLVASIDIETYGTYKPVTGIINLSPKHFLSKICHQYRCYLTEHTSEGLQPNI